MSVLARALLVGVLGAGTAVAQEATAPPPATEAVQAELRAAQQLLSRAMIEFDGPEQSRSIVLLDELVARLEALRRQGAAPDSALEMLVQGYELRGRAYYNIGLQEKAAESFRTLIQVRPQHQLSKERISPKVVDYFNSVKKALVGYLAVTSRPAGAKVSLNGEYLSLTDFFPMEVLAGEYTVEIAREGYATVTRSLSIAPRKTETLEVELTRSLASVFFVTEPAGVEIWVDGQLRATTAGTVEPELAASVESGGLNPARASSPSEVAGLSLGPHVVELRKKCYETLRRTIDTPEARDYEPQAVRLEDSVASLRLTSDPPGARIFLDGEPMGQTPKELEGVCSGKHRLEVKHASGKFVQDLVLSRNEGLSLDCPIRPSLAFLGVVAESAAGQRLAADAEEKIVQNLSSIKTLNFFAAPRETVDHTLEADKLTRKGLIPSPGADPDVLRKVTEKLAATLEVQGFLVALLPEEKLQRTAVLHLLAAGNSVSDRWSVAFGEAASYLRFLSVVDQKATVYRPWTGVITVDTLLHDGVPVLRVVPDSPGAQAGIQPGEVLHAADGKPVKRTADLLAAVLPRKPKDKLALQLAGPGGARAVELSLAETPQEIPLNDPGLLYNKVMMDLRQVVDGYPGTEAAAFARLNLALCAMHFDDFAAAHEHLVKARAELPQRPGISQGTALYYLGLSLEKLGYTKEAGDAYRAAAGQPGATLFNNDGPSVAPLAARRTGS
jgi:tetratricopeptide (TPR) repeat protein